MQKKLTTTLILISVIIVAKAQNYTTNEVRQYMSKGEQPGIEIMLSESKPEDAKSALGKWGKKMNAKIVAGKNSNEIFMDDAKIPAVSANTIDIYAVVTPADKGSKVTFFSDLGGGFVSSSAYSSQYSGMDALIKKFAKEETIEEVETQQKNEEKTLKTLEKDLKDIEAKKKDYLKDIEKAKELIQQRDQKMIVNNADISAKQQQISHNEIHDEKLLKSINKQIKDLSGDQQKYLKEISKAKVTIQQREQDIIKKDTEQVTKQEQISLQQQIIETVKSKRMSLNY